MESPKKRGFFADAVQNNVWKKPARNDHCKGVGWRFLLTYENAGLVKGDLQISGCRCQLNWPKHDLDAGK